MDNQPGSISSPPTHPAPPPPQTLQPVPPLSTNRSGPSQAQIIGIVIGVIVLLALGLLFLVWLQSVGALHVLRDILVIFLAFESILLLILIAWVALQVQSVVEYLNNEVRPILNNVQDSVSTVSTTTTFVRESVAEPLIEARSAAAGAKATLQALLRRDSGKPPSHRR